MKQLYIRKRRIKEHWTQEYVGLQVGLSKQTIQQIETGRRKPSYDVLIKLCKLFNVETNDIQQLFAVVDDTPISRQNDTTEKQ